MEDNKIKNDEIKNEIDNVISEDIENSIGVDTILENSDYIATNLQVERRLIKGKNEHKDIYLYFVSGKIRSRRIDIRFVCPKKDGATREDYTSYRNLEMIFDNKDKMPLVLKKYRIIDKVSGEVNTGVSYFVRDIDPVFGEMIGKIKPYENGDKEALLWLLRGSGCNLV